MSEPIVTTVIPLHNHDKWVIDSITSVASQDYNPSASRIVVVDDGSKDNSLDAVKSILEAGTVKKIHESNGFVQWYGKVKRYDTPLILAHFDDGHGPSFARNVGMKISWEGTDIFAFLDSDDMYCQGKISKSVEKFVTYPKIAVVYSDYDTLNSNGLHLRQYKEPYSRKRLLEECIVNCDSLISKESIEKVGMFDESMRVCEDYQLWVRLSEHYMMMHIPESLVTIRVGEHSSSNQISKEVWNECYRKVFQGTKKEK